MQNTLRLTFTLFSVAAAWLFLAAPLTAQAREGLVGDLLKDISDVEPKVMGLAKAIPDSA